MRKTMTACLSLAIAGIVCLGCDGADTAEESGTDAAVGTEAGAVEETAGSAGTEEEESETTPEAPAEPNLGASCEADEECFSLSGYPTCITTGLIKSLGLSDTAEVPGGYCSDMTCEAASDCGEDGAQCVDLGASDVTDLFNICLLGCTPDGPSCAGGQECYCDADEGIFNTEGETDFCTCMPDAIISLLTE